jgi:transposase, IS30 family
MMPYRHLTESQRNVIFHLDMMGLSKAEIGRRLGCHRSTIARELQRNRSCTNKYLPRIAQIKSDIRREACIRRPRTEDRALMKHVADHLEKKWSPQQIAGRLKCKAPKHLVGKSISHATIYRWLWSDKQRAEHFKPYLRVAHKKRRKPYGKPSKRGQISNRVSIEQRPAVVEERQRLGDWEGDTVVGKGRSGHVVTNVDRASRYLVTRRIDRALADNVDQALYAAMRRLGPDKRRTQTFDNGREFARHESIAERLGLDVYFAHPYSSWERGTNENTNGLLRQYLPKTRDFSTLTNTELASYTWQLNNRPRKCLDYLTPAEVFHQRIVALRM